ncbi:MAG TPA: exodeoxyribonuclease VII small subunit [Campylobacteraceae bacterium]|jgi:exodeoxyribonuclease VII small subunit|nr:exodeoxyribonuclease VII small subunit [Campylobacteraceae bacterium]HHD83798.1 exodeoxyribonuclease VII small subunit [Campylobacteraceae bacterium]
MQEEANNNEMSFEQKIAHAKEILEKLMDPEITLSQSVTYYKEGIKELQEATKLLENAKLEFETYNQDQKEPT